MAGRAAPGASFLLPGQAFSGRAEALQPKILGISAGIGLANQTGVAESAKEWRLGGPTVMWRMMRSDGQTSHAVINPYQSGAAVVWFVNGRPLGVRDFADVTGALRWSEQLQSQNWTAGWRLIPD